MTSLMKQWLQTMPCQMPLPGVGPVLGPGSAELAVVMWRRYGSL